MLHSGTASVQQVASQYSEDKARQGGDLCWKTRQQVVGAFAEAAFKLQACPVICSFYCPTDAVPTAQLASCSPLADMRCSHWQLAGQ